MESQDVRAYIQKALQLDLIGPSSQDLEYQTEILNQPPSKWYLTGFLVPFGAPVEMKYDPTADDHIETFTNKDIAEDAKTPETTAARKVPFPSSIGLSFLIPAQTENLEVTVEWGDYQPQEREIETSAENNNEDNPSKPPTQILWHRLPNLITIPISLPANYEKISLDVSDRDGLKSGLKLYISRCPVATSPQLPIGTQSVSIFVVNHRVYQPHSNRLSALQNVIR